VPGFTVVQENIHMICLIIAKRGELGVRGRVQA